MCVACSFINVVATKKFPNLTLTKQFIGNKTDTKLELQIAVECLR